MSEDRLKDLTADVFATGNNTLVTQCARSAHPDAYLLPTFLIQLLNAGKFTELPSRGVLRSSLPARKKFLAKRSLEPPRIHPRFIGPCFAKDSCVHRGAAPPQERGLERMERRGLWAAGGMVLLLVVGVVAVLAVGTGFAKDENAAGAKKCSEATLDGTYLFGFDGVGIEGNEQVPVAVAGYEVYDGNGKVKGVASVNRNGEVFRNERFSGTYTVKADCTGTLTFPDGAQADLFIAPDGSMFTFVETDPGFVAAGFELRGTAKRVAQ